MMVVFVFMMVLMVMMIVVVLLVAVDGHPHMGARNAAGLSGHRGHLHPRQAQAVHGSQKLLLLAVAQQLIQGGHEHIPCRPHAAL